MAVKRSQNVARALSIIETIASHQPIGVSALAKMLDEDRSAVQRTVMTLADAGWIQIAPEPPQRWELAARLFSIAHLPHSKSDLNARARRALDEIRDETGETALLTVPSGVQFIVLAAADSRHMLRMSPDIGEVTLSSAKSATGRAILPYVGRERQIAILGRAPTRAESVEFTATRERGYSISIDDVMRGATNLGAPVFDHRGEPMGAIVVSGPSTRMTVDRHKSIGKLLVRHARILSHRAPAPVAD